jgi:iron(III) transport system substrate-binding protein
LDTLLRAFSTFAVLAVGSLTLGTLSAQARTQLAVYSTLEADFLAELKKALEADNGDLEIVWHKDSTGVLTARILAERGERATQSGGLRPLQ